jgi:hypothetical protein
MFPDVEGYKNITGERGLGVIQKLQMAYLGCSRKMMPWIMTEGALVLGS